jgi:hypothetical protein
MTAHFADRRGCSTARGDDDVPLWDEASFEHNVPTIRAIREIRGQPSLVSGFFTQMNIRVIIVPEYVMHLTVQLHDCIPPGTFLLSHHSLDPGLSGEGLVR